MGQYSFVAITPNFESFVPKWKRTFPKCFASQVYKYTTETFFEINFCKVYFENKIYLTRYATKKHFRLVFFRKKRFERVLSITLALLECGYSMLIPISYFLRNDLKQDSRNLSVKVVVGQTMSAKRACTKQQRCGWYVCHIYIYIYI